VVDSGTLVRFGAGQTEFWPAGFDYGGLMGNAARRSVLYLLVAMLAMPSLWLIFNRAGEPLEPIHPGRVRGPEVNFYGESQSALGNLQLNVSGHGRRASIFFTLAAPAVVELVNEGRMNFDATTLKVLKAKGIQVTEAERQEQFAAVQEIALGAGPWLLSGQFRGARTSDGGTWRLVTPQIGSSCHPDQPGFAPWTSSDGQFTLRGLCSSDSAGKVSVGMTSAERVDQVTDAPTIESSGSLSLVWGLGAPAKSGVDVTVSDRQAESRRELWWFIAGIGLAVASSIAASELSLWSRDEW
jgi:hypothetical protein